MTLTGCSSCGRKRYPTNDGVCLMCESLAADKALEQGFKDAGIDVHHVTVSSSAYTTFLRRNDGVPYTDRTRAAPRVGSIVRVGERGTQARTYRRVVSVDETKHPYVYNLMLEYI
ncbi:MAG: hypothetical protein ACPG4T_03360 [Nannocystaceae bacterium]